MYLRISITLERFSSTFPKAGLYWTTARYNMLLEYNYRIGEVPEWTNGAVSKIAVGSKPTGGSNPSLAVGEDYELPCKRIKANL